MNQTAKVVVKGSNYAVVRFFMWVAIASFAIFFIALWLSKIGFSCGRIRRANNCTLGGCLLSWQRVGQSGRSSMPEVWSARGLTAST